MSSFFQQHYRFGIPKGSLPFASPTASSTTSTTTTTTESVPSITAGSTISAKAAATIATATAIAAANNRIAGTSTTRKRSRSFSFVVPAMAQQKLNANAQANAKAQRNNKSFAVPSRFTAVVPTNMRPQKEIERIGNKNKNNSSNTIKSNISPSTLPPLAVPPLVSSSSAASSKTLTDVTKILGALREYVHGSNDYYRTNTPLESTNTTTTTTTTSNSSIGNNRVRLPLQFDQIPKTLLGLVATHCETDAKAVVLAAKSIVHYADSNSNSKIKNTDDIRNNRYGILREIFGIALRSGGTEAVLHALQRLGPSACSAAVPNPLAPKASNSINNGTSNNSNAKKDVILGCWSVIKVGLQTGLSRRSQMLVINACLADMDDIELPSGGNNGSSTSSSSTTTDTDTDTTTKFTNHVEILSCILGVLMEALSRPELSARDLAVERNSILSSCLLLLSKACRFGISPAEAIAAHGTTTTNNNDDDDDGNAILLIEGCLGVLVVCALKGLLVRTDFERLVPACSASLSRYLLSSNRSSNGTSTSSSNKNSNQTSMENNHHHLRSIPVRIVQLLEAEDATIGLWLRHTYGIPALADNTGNSTSSTATSTTTVGNHPFFHASQYNQLSLALHQTPCPGGSSSSSSRSGAGSTSWEPQMARCHHHHLGHNQHRRRPLPPRGLPPNRMCPSVTTVGGCLDDLEETSSEEEDDESEDDDHSV